MKEMEDIFVGRVMTSSVETVRGDASVLEAADRMEQESINSVLVTDEENELQGILTSSDVVTLVAAQKDAAATPVGEQMTADVLTTRADSHVREAADTLMEHSIHHLPVVDDENHLIGIVSTTDLTAYLSHVQRPSP